MLHNDPQKRMKTANSNWSRASGPQAFTADTCCVNSEKRLGPEHSENIHGTFIADSTGSAACTMKPSLTTQREPSQESFENFALSFLLLFSVSVRNVLSSK
jgi:hypothetical protein